MARGAAPAAAAVAESSQQRRRAVSLAMAMRAAAAGRGVSRAGGLLLLPALLLSPVARPIMAALQCTCPRCPTSSSPLTRTTRAPDRQQTAAAAMACLAAATAGERAQARVQLAASDRHWPASRRQQQQLTGRRQTAQHSMTLQKAAAGPDRSRLSSTARRPGAAWPLHLSRPGARRRLQHHHCQHQRLTSVLASRSPCWRAGSCAPAPR